MTLNPRPDQETDPPPTVLAPGGNAGIFRGRLVEIIGGAPPGSGIFVYNSLGQLIGAWTGQAGTDPIDHNSVPGGLYIQSPTGAQTIIVDQVGITIEKHSGVQVPPFISLVDDTASTTDGTRVTDQDIVTPVIFAVIPGDTSGVAEDWHNFGSLAIGGWTVNTGRYKMLADSGMVAVQLQNLAPSTHPADGTTIYSVANGLPSGYRPLHATRVVAWSQNQGTEACGIQFETDGSITIYGIGGTTTTRVDCHTTAVSTL